MPLNIILLATYFALMAYILPQWGKQPWASDSTACAAPLGHPENLDLHGQTYHYQYDTKGRVISRRGGIEELRFEYVWQHDRPIHITQSFGEAGQPAWVKLELHFIYNQNGDVAYARDSDGRVARFGYNDAGDLVWVESLSGVRMEISYDPVCDQPSRYDLIRLGHAGTGSITFIYDRECKEIEKKFDGEELASYFSSTSELLDQIHMDVFH